MLYVFPFGVHVFSHNPLGAQRSPAVGKEKSERPMKGLPDCKTMYAKQSACTKWQQWPATPMKFTKLHNSRNTKIQRMNPSLFRWSI